MDNVWLVIVFMIGGAVASVMKPQRAQCPKGWFVEGVRSSGATQCRRELVDDPLDWPGEDRRDRDRRDIKPDNVALPLQVYCTGGSLPIVVDSRTVGCQMGVHYQWR